jgi:hypothetical protein
MSIFRNVGCFAASIAVSLCGFSQSQPKVDWTPMQFRQVSGTRPFVPIEMNGKPFLMMVHSNSGHFLVTTHGGAASIGMSDLKKDGNYGITSTGKASDMGIAHTTLSTLRFGATELHDVPLSVFELPDQPLDGMLGLPWLRSSRVIVDFDSYRIGVPKTEQDGKLVDQQLVQAGWTPHAMRWDADSKRFTVLVRIDGHEARMIPSTVSNVVVDSVWAKENGERLGPVIDHEGGPTGAVVDAYIFKNYAQLSIDGQAVKPIWPESWDLFGYSAEARKKGAPAGFLGAEFMLLNSGIIDFGNGILFVKSAK